MAREREVAEMRVRVENPEISAERFHQELARVGVAALLHQLGGVERRVVVGVRVGKVAQRDGVEFVRRSRLRPQLLPERDAVAIRCVDVVVLLPVRVQIAATFESEGPETEPRHVDAHVEHLAAGIRFTAPRPALVDGKGDDVPRHRRAHLRRAERHLLPAVEEA